MAIYRVRKAINSPALEPRQFLSGQTQFDAEFDTGDGPEGAFVTRVARGVYRVDEPPAFTDAFDYGDTIELGLAPDDRFTFIRVARKADFAKLDYVISGEFSDSEPLLNFLRAVHEAGGYAETLFRGWLRAYTPRTSTFDLETEFDRAWDEFERRSVEGP